MRRATRRLVGRGALTAAAAVVGSYLAVRSGASTQLDAPAASLAGRPLGTAADRVISATTDLGSVYGIVGVSGMLLLTGRRRLALDVAAASFLAWGAAQAAKPLLPRERPYVGEGAARLVAVPAGTSWPSGHAAVVAAMTSALWPELQPAARAGCAAAAAGVGATRLYVGVHHATDLVAGYGVGVLATTAWGLVRPR